MAKRITKTAKSSKGKTTPSHKGTVWGVEPEGFKRISISYKDTTINFRLNPEEYKYERKTRAAIYKTQNSNVVQQFGSDIAVITMRGTTGWHKDNNGQSGKDRFDALNRLIAQYQNDTQNGGHTAQAMKFNNYTDNKYYTVTVAPDGFTYDRSLNRPLLYEYTLTLMVIGGDDTPTIDSSLTAVVGTGSGSSISKGQDATSPVSKTDAKLVNTIQDAHATKQSIKKATAKLKKKHGK